MKKLIFSAILALLAVPTLAGAATFYVDASATGTADGSSAENAFLTLNAGLEAVSSVDDTIQIAAGLYDLSSQLNITKAVNIVGNGPVILKAITDFGTTNGSKHLLVVTTGTEEAPVTISGITFDCDTKCYGVQAYSNAQVLLNNVTITNSKGAGLTVNGSNVTASNLITSGNAWGAVNVDPGSGVTTPSVFTLTSGTLTENNQIWSDGAKVSETATVAVNAVGYSKYFKAGATKPFFFWKNSLTNAATITTGATTTLYASIQSAVEAAVSGDTINIAPGTYTENGQILINKNLSIVGADKNTTVIKPAQDTSAGNVDTAAWILVNADTALNLNNVTLDGDSPNKKINWAIASYGTGVIDNNIIKNVKYGSYVGRGIVVFGDMTISNNIFENIERIGVHVRGAYSGSAVGKAMVTGNTYTGKGTGDFLDYGIEVGAGASATITNNVISENRGVVINGNGPGEDSTSAGILVTDYYGTGTNATITGNTLTNNTAGIAVGYDPSDLSVVSAHRNSFVGNTVAIENVTPSVNASLNYWGTSNPDFGTGTTLISGTVTVSPWYADSAMTALSSGMTIIGDIKTTTFATESTMTSGAVTVVIPAGTTITGSTAWDGVFDLPKATTTATLPNTLAGFALTGVMAIELGSKNVSLSFSNPIKLTFPGQAGKLVGWSQGGTFQKISTTCTAAAVAPALAAGEDCSIDDGADLVVWTRHATAFITYTQTVIPPAPVSSGGGGYFAVVNTPASPVAVLATSLASDTTGQVLGAQVSSQAKGKVLGATAYAFGRNLRLGSRGVDVEELQKMLIASGHLNLTSTTQYFGSLTRAAVIKWQKEKKLPATGYFGPMSRAVVVQ